MISIYIITNNITRLSYIGQTKHSIIARFKKHYKYEECPLIHRAMRKYGLNNFSLDVLAYTDCPNEANYLEEVLISGLNSLHPYGYNLAKGGNNREILEETRLKMSLKKKGRKLSEITKQKMSASRKGRIGPMLGKTHSTEAKEKMSATRKGVKTKPLKEETKLKISLTKLGKLPYNKGTGKSVCINGVMYKDVVEAVEKTGINRQTIYFRINSKTFIEYTWLN
jgi:group I intron endonuclease